MKGTLSLFHLYLRIRYLKLNFFIYHYRVCRHFIFSQLSPQRSNKSSICINILYITPFIINLYFNIWLKDNKTNFACTMYCTYIYIENANISSLYNFHIWGQTNIIFVHFSCISRSKILSHIKIKNIRIVYIL